MVHYPAWDQDEARSIVSGLSHLEGATLPILHALQEEFGYVDPQVVPLIAEVLNLSRADVHGTISFYHDFRTAPPPRRIVKLCRAEACQALGCDTVVEELAREHGIVVDDHGSQEAVVETVYCLGNCALGPSALIEGELIGRANADRIAALCGARQ
ncbi:MULTISPECIES: NAD(P)H-dependent oxidoreductase subunit E [unclassified Bosea (in: a-proteobacteria)]|uniref:NAD(P)H-dependent oxidoreductase subunit E n=1 Tax=unclassified Bosea (in: a-proteobacteria) TaxID=2653178 RepID=UPI000F751761|nr:MULTISPECIES: NAD(P)H-dependent oxidoreductase subunit E [unclassified Bosea (in: a-proteobacteria)]AZO80165.1 NADH-quinone oxidoreductase subunit E [Bosea sp. Tri-49]RXT22953.1 NADH-quinone oxidoreductase subunit E [Bosea sp. Tri-39]RXT38423.1 NADH-quinone oxidoreductase subunit E [Bosea sp. Tri-54]